MVGGFGLSWQAAFGVITLLYFYSHYLFASGAAHIGAMYTAFLSVAIACGAFVAMYSLGFGPGLGVLTHAESFHIGGFKFRGTIKKKECRRSTHRFCQGSLGLRDSVKV